DSSQEDPVVAQIDADWNYVDDQLCAICHQKIFDSYQEIGMAQSFRNPNNIQFIEDFAADPFYHERSHTYFKIEKRDTQLFYSQFQKDANGQRINFHERKIDWVMGSGNKSRTYLYQTTNGEMYELPLAWYSDSRSWAMAPGFALEKGPDLTRQVKRECMFCHNAYPKEQTPDRLWDPDIYSRNMPQGIGCQRCHGPGEKHIKKALADDQDSILLSIVNPGKLSPGRRDDVCNQCHLQPTIILTGVRKYDRGDYSFMAGERLRDYQVFVDIEEKNVRQEDRFEINHHAYRLYQSKCYQGSRGKLGCVSCHDPHRKIAEEEKQDHFRSVCLECHQAHDAKPVSEIYRDVPLDQCVTCHMPLRRSQDVVEVLVTDHWIRRSPPTEDWTKPLSEKSSSFDAIRFLNSDFQPNEPSKGLYLASPVIRTIPDNASAMEYLQQQMQESQVKEITPYYDLLSAQINQHQYEGAKTTAEFILDQQPKSELALISKGVCEFRNGEIDTALETFLQATRANPESANSYYNLGIVLQTIAKNLADQTSESMAIEEKYEEALTAFTKVLSLKDNHGPALLHKAQCQEALGQPDAAVKTYLTLLALQPKYVEAYTGLADLYHRLGKPADAKRYLLHGLTMVSNPESIRDKARNLSIDLR
ncbi:MAG: tetratricopeptide repeat protein, partial [Saprospiraceae bacterium]|nr:tetratricopeptide repeat protein [Saprospiraceae bacterium]